MQRRPSYLIWLIFFTVCSYPIYNVFLPIYSFWHLDDFSWGNTRQVSAKQVQAENDLENEEILRRLPQGFISEYQDQDMRLDVDENQDWSVLDSKKIAFNNNENMKRNSKVNLSKDNINRLTKMNG